MPLFQTLFYFLNWVLLYSSTDLLEFTVKIKLTSDFGWSSFLFLLCAQIIGIVITWPHLFIYSLFYFLRQGLLYLMLTLKLFYLLPTLELYVNQAGLEATEIYLCP